MDSAEEGGLQHAVFDGITLEYEVVGAGEPVVLIHSSLARLLTGKLKPKRARHNGHGLFLKMVQMHRRTDIRRRKECDLHAIAVSITNDAEKGEYLAFAVLDPWRL
jgi:hypothetical protein